MYIDVEDIEMKTFITNKRCCYMVMTYDYKKIWGNLSKDGNFYVVTFSRKTMQVNIDDMLFKNYR